MNKNFYYSAFLVIALLLSSCSKNETNTTSDPVSVSPSNASSSSVSSIPSSHSPEYFGDWTVTGLAGSSPISTEVDQSLIKTKASYSNEKASFGKNEILTPQYKELNLTNEEFLNEYRIELNDIGVKSESVKTVSINNWTNAGSLLIIKDDQTMIFLWDGNYYELKKDK
ncbi:hypothetical protein [Paenibacillus pini]|uniref:Lipoprotein n=1 Tax=Paenibacillus pini JCM 16418 TaxID=1236976 RepID=W7YER1_9BACL|nr:hypothetical protein [Paenibacillus pini]GAF07002.1 hypothetical protein JCM16418_989 [Paenibacillus pini JCM 16418]